MPAAGYRQRGNWTYKSEKALTRQELMKAAEMLARDLVLRVCASDGEFRRDWIARGAGPKRVVPLAVAPGADPELAAAIAGAATEMGAQRLLACRTRAAFMYDPVLVLPVSAQALLDVVGRWGQPDDFLVCLPDGSAAVLVSVAGYALAAGQAPFVAALAGPDVAGARERFTVRAREIGDQRLRILAGRYGGPTSRHAPRRALRPDVAERLSALAAAIRRRSLVTAVLRFAAAAAGWAAIAVIVTTLLSAPRSSHVLPAVGGALWLLLQVFALARTHTLSWAACLRMAAAGAACAMVFAAAVRLAVHPAALHAWRALLGPADEAVKLVPVVVFWLVARNRFARLAAVDYLLLGVASGAGFALAENTVAALAVPGAGWHIAALLPGWSDAGVVRFPGEAVATGLATAGIGLAAATRAAGANAAAARRPWRRWRRWLRWLSWLLPVVLLAVAMLDHYRYGAVAGGMAVPGWLTRLHAVLGNGHASRWLLVALLAAAIAVDFAAQRRVTDLVPPLPGVPLWARLARDARGSLVSARIRWPARTARGRRARQWAAARVAVTEALVALGHEAAFLLVALLPRQRPQGVFAASLAFARQRRELAMREARAGGRVRRDVPRREGVWTAWQRLTAALALGSSQAAVAGVVPGAPQMRSVLAQWPAAGPAVQAVTVRAAALQRAPGGDRHAYGVPQGRPADLVTGIPALHAWFNQFIPAGQVLIVAAAIGFFVLLVSGWALPVPLAAPRRAGRAGRPSLLLRGLAATPAPGQFLFRLLRLGGDLLPPATARLLAGHGVARPYHRAPPARHAISASLPQALPRGAAEALQPEAHGPDGGHLDRSGWLFPAGQVRRWLGHAPEFGVDPAAGDDEGADGPDPTARLTEALRQIAEAAGSLRLEEVTFRNRPARAVVDRASGAAVFFTPAGEFTGCAVLTEEQLFRLVTELKL